MKCLMIEESSCDYVIGDDCGLKKKMRIESEKMVESLNDQSLANSK